MENRLTRWLYDHSPVFFQNLYASAYGAKKRLNRYAGPYYKEYFEFFQKSKSWSREELRAYQDDKLAQLVLKAYEHVPFWRRRFDELRLTPADVTKAEDLPKLPYLTKQDIHNAGRELLADNYKSLKILTDRSGGSTGSPNTYWRSQESNQMEYAFHWARRRPGVHRGMPYASFTGLQIIPPNRLKPPFWRVNYANNQRCYGVFHMSDETLPFYIEDLEKHPRVWLEGYVTPIYLVAKYILDNGYVFKACPKCIFTTSEQLDPSHREVIEKAFRTRVYDQYGQSEQAASITEYECGHMHDDMDYAITEYIPQSEEDGDQIVEIISTPLYNYAMPLLRCQIGDFLRIAKNPPQCDVNAGPIVLSIAGRTTHVLVAADGRIVTNAGLSLVVPRSRNIKAVQYVQDEVGVVRILVIRAPGYSPADEELLLDILRARIGDKTELRIEYVDELIKTGAGKTLSIISNITDDS